MATVDDLNDVAQAFLDASIDALNLTTAGAPGRAYVSPGEPALDCCGQLTVWMQALEDVGFNPSSGVLSSQKALNRGQQPRATIFVQATRCVDMTPDGRTGLPDPDLLQDAAFAINQDAWALRCHLLWSLRHGDLAQICSGAELISASALVPQGGCVGWTFTFRYPIEGGIIGT